MQKRAVRFSVLALLLAAGAGAGLVAWDIERRVQIVDEDRRDVDSRLDRLISDVAGIAASQHAYVAPGQPVEQAVDLVSRLIQQIATDAEALRVRARSGQAPMQLDAIRDGIASLTQADTRARASLGIGELLMAADVIFGEGRDILSVLDTTLRALRTSEGAAFAAERSALTRQSWMVVGGLALLWGIGLLALTRVPAARMAAATAPLPEEAPAAAFEGVAIEPARAAPAAAPIDLEAAAELCAAISRATTTTPLPDLLARAAAILHARGVILWMGAGDDLFAAAAHGYDPHVVSRLGSIGRAADNATAAAWRTGQLRTVSGDGVTHGAIVAPMFSADTCAGVLAVEVPHGREDDRVARAVTTMIAAQLAAAVAAWPEASRKVEENTPDLPLGEPLPYAQGRS